MKHIIFYSIIAITTTTISTTLKNFYSLPHITANSLFACDHYQTKRIWQYYFLYFSDIFYSHLDLEIKNREVFSSGISTLAVHSYSKASRFNRDYYWQNDSDYQSNRHIKISESCHALDYQNPSSTSRIWSLENFY
jgi:hypothetical protein